MPETYFRAPFDRLGGLPVAAQMMAFDFETYLPEDCLTKVDRMSMAHSIESRVPAPRSPGRGIRGVAAGVDAHPGRPPEAPVETARLPARAARDPRPSQAGVRRPHRPLVPRLAA